VHLPTPPPLDEENGRKAFEQAQSERPGCCFTRPQEVHEKGGVIFLQLDVNLGESTADSGRAKRGRRELNGLAGQPLHTLRSPRIGTVRGGSK
jgi:hypothetical protein